MLEQIARLDGWRGIIASCDTFRTVLEFAYRG